jgi:hypothetical protein
MDKIILVVEKCLASLLEVGCGAGDRRTVMLPLRSAARRDIAKAAAWRGCPQRRICGMCVWYSE